MMNAHEFAHMVIGAGAFILGGGLCLRFVVWIFGME